MLKIAFVERDRPLAERMARDLQTAGYEVALDGLVSAGDREDVLIPIYSPVSSADAALERAVDAALDAGQHIVPVLTGGAVLPALLDHLNEANFNDGYTFEALEVRVKAALAPDARLPLRVRTPAVKRANRRTGIIVAALALIMFAAGLYAVGVMGIQAPIKEFNTIETMVALTRDVLVAPELEIYARFLPRSTEEAANYAPTLRAVPTVYRPLMALTATAYSLGTLQPETTATPEAESTDGA